MRQPPGTVTVDVVAATGNPATPSQRGDIERWFERQRTRLAEHVAVERATHLFLRALLEGRPRALCAGRRARGESSRMAAATWVRSTPVSSGVSGPVRWRRFVRK